METKPSYLTKRKAAFKFAFRGIAYFFKREAHAKIHLLAAITAIILGFYFKITSGEWIAIVLCIGIVFATEAINSALEILTDSIYKDYHKWAEQIKDIAAGAVLICAIISIIVAAIIFVPYVIKFMNTNYT